MLHIAPPRLFYIRLLLVARSLPANMPHLAVGLAAYPPHDRLIVALAGFLFRKRIASYSVQKVRSHPQNQVED